MKHNSPSVPLVVIGAGPAGLTAAHEATRAGIRTTVLEASRWIGGIARTEEHQGYRFDIGGHRFYTKVPEVQRLWEEALGPELRATPRLSRIHFNNKFYPYPLAPWTTLQNLGIGPSMMALASYAKARIQPTPQEDTFEDWVTNRFGRRLYETFFKTYTEKVWGLDCRQIRAEWAAQRIQDLSLLTAVRQAILPARSGPKTLIREFHYPRLGPGMMWDRFAERLKEEGGRVETSADVMAIHHAHGRVHSVTFHQAGTHHTLQTQRVISSMALDDLIARFNPAPPPAVLDAGRALRYRDFILVGLVLRRQSNFADNWIYIHSPAVRVGRIQNFGNWSPDLLPDQKTTSLGMEYFCSRGDDLWESSDDALIQLASREVEQLGFATRAQVAWGVVIRQPKAYPVYDSHHHRHLLTIRSWLDTLTNFQTIGRNGQHRYNNQDHSMLTGIAAIQRFLGQPADPWQVNTERSYYEELKTSS